MSFRSRHMAVLCMLAIVLVLTAAGMGTAHVPDKCVPLFHAVGKVAEGVVRKGNEANALAMQGLEYHRRVTADDYGMLADRLAQLLGAQIEMFSRLKAAIECADSKR